MIQLDLWELKSSRDTNNNDNSNFIHAQVLNNMFFSNDSDEGSDTSGTSIGRRDDLRSLMSAKVTQELTQNYEDLVKVSVEISLGLSPLFLSLSLFI